jgi:pyruvyl transferase EpsO
MSSITFIIPNRGGKNIDFVIRRLRSFYPDEKYMVINQEDNEPFKRGPLFNVAYHYVDTEYLCLIDNDLFFKTYVDLIGIYKKRGCQVMQPFNVIEQVTLKDGSYEVTKVGKPNVITNDHTFGPRGGITFVSREVFKNLNGFSSLLMGYGYEDNEFACRCAAGKFINIDNHICHITHPTRDTKNLHQQLNCVLFNNEPTSTHGGIDTTSYKELFKEMKGDVLYVRVTDIRSTNDKANELLSLHRPENIRKACEYMCDYYIKKYVKSNYVLLGVPKHMNIGDTLIWEAERSLLNKLPYKRIATFFFGTYMHHIKITPTDTIVFSGGGYLNDIWGGSLDYINKVLETFPNNRVVFLPNSVHKSKTNSPGFTKFTQLIKARKIKPVIFSREYQGIKNARRLFGVNAVHVLVPDVVLAWDIDKYMADHKLTKTTGNKTLFIDRNDRERINSKSFKFDVKSDWQQMVKRPLYANENMRCVDWEATVKDRLINETIQWVDQFGTVYSNRMHGAILAWLLGKETYLINNSYGKSKSLYETWLLDATNLKIIE